MSDTFESTCTNNLSREGEEEKEEREKRRRRRGGEYNYNPPPFSSFEPPLFPLF